MEIRTPDADTTPAREHHVPTYVAVGGGVAAFVAVTTYYAFCRYATFHNRTFDLALYAREAWGLSHGDFWDPIANVNFFGMHVAWVLFPLGFLGQFFGTVPVLLVAQSLAFGLTAWPLAAIGMRRFGSPGALAAAGAFLLYPNLTQVATYEFHPGSLGLLPLACALDVLDRARASDSRLRARASDSRLRARASDSQSEATAVAAQSRYGWLLIAACLGLLACRADFALLVLCIGALTWVSLPALRRTGAIVVVIGVAYLLLQTVVLRRMFWPAQGSLDLHFGTWGGSPFGFVRALFTQPSKVIAHLTAFKRLSYLPRVLWPLAFLPLLGPRVLVLTLPFLAINLISTFPTTTELYSHYLTPAVPVLIVAMLDGISTLRRWLSALSLRVVLAGALGVLALTALLGQRLHGGMPWSVDYDHKAFVWDDYSDQAQRVVKALPVFASVQAPDPLLAHLAERPSLYRVPPPDRGAQYVVLDVRYRETYAHQENLLRTLEEPVTRAWMARRDYGLWHVEPWFFVLKQGENPRFGIANRYILDFPGMRSAVPLSHCLWLLSAWLAPSGLELELATQAPCPSDLALRIGTNLEDRPAHVDLLFDGFLSPAQLRDEYVMSWHALTSSERASIIKYGLRLGALRSSGAPPDPDDPVSISVPLIH